MKSVLIVLTGVIVFTGCERKQANQSNVGSSDTGKEFKPNDPALIESNNRGVGLMGKFKYEEARGIFEELVGKHPNWNEVQVNLAMAILNRQREGDEAKAMAILDRVVKDEPGNLRAQYCSGLLKLYLESPEEALPHFELVAKAAPPNGNDAYAAYYVGQCLAQQRQYEEAVEWYEKALKLDPYLRSAYYALSQALRPLNRGEEAAKRLEEFQRLEKNPRAKMVEFKYTRMGPKGEAMAVDVAERPRMAKPEGPIFLDPIPLLEDGEKYAWKKGGGKVGLPDRAVSITACDIDMDGDVDVFIADVLDQDDLHNAVCMNDGTGKFTLDAEHILAKVPEVNAALWGDYDNDGLTDVYLCRRGANMLWRHLPSPSGSGGGGEGRGDGGDANKPSPLTPLPEGEGKRWRDVTAATGTGNGEFDTVDGAMVDFDHDGDLDIFCVNADGPNELLSNNLDGTFRPIAKEAEIAGSGKGSRQVLPVDLDGDRDLDIIVINHGPPHEVWINDRLWRYQASEELKPQAIGAVVAIAAADVDSDGQVELLHTDTGGRILQSVKELKGNWKTEVFEPLRSGVPPFGHQQILVADVDGDGGLDVLVADKLPGVARTDAVRGWSLVTLDPMKGPSIVGSARENGAPMIWRPGPGRLQFGGLSFTGRTDPGSGPPAMRSNASGIGTHFAARMDSMWVAGSTLRNSSGPGQSLQPVAVGLGGHEQIDFVSIDWSDGVFQSEIDLKAGELHKIVEEQRQLSSCPVLFAWNGSKYEFVTDLLGVGGIGYLAAVSEGASEGGGLQPTYAPSRPWEKLMLPGAMLQARDGKYVLKLGEPMEEACYLDAARLVEYEVPPGWKMTLDERMNVMGQEPTGEARFYREEILPRRVVNERGEDVTEDVLRADLRAAEVGELDERFIGRLQGEQVLVVEFDAVIGDSLPSPLTPLPEGEGKRKATLIIDGWIEYPYSQTMFGAWQAGADYRAPTVEARGEDGEWVVVLEQFGYPAGMPRQMSVGLAVEKLPKGTKELRIRTNQEIYFDRIAIAYVEECPGVVKRELKLSEARLMRTGFAKRTTGPQRQPYYDYDERVPLWDTRYQRGYYTEFGAVDELIGTKDGALAIFGPGEEVHMEFDAPESVDDADRSLGEGWARVFVLEVDGWCKDMDLFTKDGETVEPVPGVPGAHRRDACATDELHRRFNTRYESGR
ncbi:MAG: FG-GAP-like repeat-containing protein [Phycisphaerales bacterium]|nr:FG-GAP-like repeat-containing protein [Phycisphaerales bacterium]